MTHRVRAHATQGLGLLKGLGLRLIGGLRLGLAVVLVCVPL